MSHSNDKHGWNAVPRSLARLLASRTSDQQSRPIKLQDPALSIPDNELVRHVLEFVKQQVPVTTFNHSMRVYHFGRTITEQHFPAWKYSHETLLLTALLHDIGTTHKNRASTKLSFEFQGGMIAHGLLQSLGAELSQAEAVCEAIIRHQDLGDTGNITTLTAIIHFATVLDNIGLHAELVHEDTIRSIVKMFPREGWTGCFSDVLKQECQSKPWANTTRIEGFVDMVETNKVMEPYD